MNPHDEAKRKATNDRLIVCGCLGVVVAVVVAIVSLTSYYSVKEHPPGEQPTFAFIGELMIGAVVGGTMFLVWTGIVELRDYFKKK
ncbi:MAG: hypothetical protein ACOYON_04825 [Fimbriimonas sp.]